MKFPGKGRRLLAPAAVCLGIGLLCCIALLGESAGSHTPAKTEVSLSLEQLLGEDYVEFLTETITMQMENRMEKDPEVVYAPIAEQAPLNDYAEIGEDTKFEVDQDGYLEIIFPAGTVTDENHGEQRFRVARIAVSREPVKQEEDWKLLLVNPQNRIPEDFSVMLIHFENDQAFDERAFPELQQMLSDARAAGLSPVVCSSYRTQEQQESLYANKISRLLAEGYSQEEAEAEAGRWVAIPGTSEHQLGLAVDIVAESYQVLDEQQENTPEQQWLMKNAHRYGFILRYPQEKSDITRIGYEPWHYRYVGKEAAGEIYARGICLEEYLEETE